MRIILIGDFGNTLDEGMRKVSAQFKLSAKPNHVVLPVQTSNFCSGKTWGVIRRFNPDCLHYVTGPTLRSLSALKLHQLTLPHRPITVATGLRPNLGRVARSLLRYLKPDIYLAQSRTWANVFSRAGSRVVDLPNVVDTDRFSLVSADRKRALKQHWRLPLDKPVVLHVGHVRQNRNLDTLIDVQRTGLYQVWIVGSETNSQTGQCRNTLQEAGCLLHTRFVPEIQSVYQAADVYVFTVRPSPPGTFRPVGVIDFPLSILEALACGLPVLTTRHDALDYFLGHVPEIQWFDGSSNGCVQSLKSIRGEPSKFRAVAEEYSVSRFTARLQSLYANVATISASMNA